MSFWVVFLAAVLLTGLVIAAVLLSLGVNAVMNGRDRESAMTIASLRRVLQSIYNGTLRESLPREFLALLRELPGKGPQKRNEDRSGRLALN